MRAFKIIFGIIIFFVDILLFYSFPYRSLYAAIRPLNFAIMGAGFILYLLIHMIRKPESFYIWNHEFSHLIMSKLFLKKVKGFHITSRRGGRVELAGSNFLIDLSPYFFYPLMYIILFLAILSGRAGFSKVIPLYFLLSGFIMGMMAAFTLESLMAMQEDIKRNGVFFSFSLILMINTLFIPLYFIPGIANKKAFLHDFLYVWWNGFSSSLVSIMGAALDLFKSLKF